MEFRPCIDIHNGQVKQIVGSSLKDEGSYAKENFVSNQDASFFAGLYEKMGFSGGHIILLNPPGSEHYEATRQQAMHALQAYPKGLQIGGGINPDNAADFLEAGASHVIVTSYVFQNGSIQYDHLEQLVSAVGKKQLVLDLSCRKKEDGYYIVTDRWQKFTREKVTTALLDRLRDYADEYLIHAVDVEGKTAGIEEPLVELLAGWDRLPVTYAGGVGSYEDLLQLKEKGRNRVNVTIGSALELFGGTMELTKIADILKS